MEEDELARGETPELLGRDHVQALVIFALRTRIALIAPGGAGRSLFEEDAARPAGKSLLALLVHYLQSDRVFGGLPFGVLLPFGVRQPLCAGNDAEAFGAAEGVNPSFDIRRQIECQSLIYDDNGAQGAGRNVRHGERAKHEGGQEEAEGPVLLWRAGWVV